MPLLDATTTITIGTSVGTGTTGTTAPAAPSTPATPGAPIPTDAAKPGWAMAAGATVYVNVREGAPGPLAWVPYVVAYVFADGNAALIREPGFVAYTGDMAVGTNLRRKGEVYADAYPGP